jgi:molybdate transport system ATP-binding protein
MRVVLDSNHCELEIPLGSAQPGEEVQVAIRAGDILLATEKPRGLSARNVLEGTVVALQTHGSLVAVRVNAGVGFIVHVTPGAARSLQLVPGLVLWLVVKTHSCHVVAPH